MRAKPSPGTNQYTKEVSELNSPSKTTEDIAQEIGISKRTAQRSCHMRWDIKLRCIMGAVVAGIVILGYLLYRLLIWAVG